MGKKQFIFFAACGVLLFVVEPALANRLVDAAERGTSEINSIVRAGSSIGVLIGAGMMSFGMGPIGKSVLGGSLFGVLVSFAGRPMIELISGLF